MCIEQKGGISQSKNRGSKGKKHVLIGSAGLRISPYADLHSGGLALNLNF